MVLTLSKSLDTLSVHASTVFIGIAEQKAVEMFLDGAADTLSCNPLGDRIRLDITEILERNFLRKRIDKCMSFRDSENLSDLHPRCPRRRPDRVVHRIVSLRESSYQREDRQQDRPLLRRPHHRLKACQAYGSAAQHDDLLSDLLLRHVVA